MFESLTVDLVDVVRPIRSESVFAPASRCVGLVKLVGFFAGPAFAVSDAHHFVSAGFSRLKATEDAVFINAIPAEQCERTFFNMPHTSI